jgi:hypothetical protein
MLKWNWEGLDWIHMAHVGAFVNTVMNLRSLKNSTIILVAELISP